MTRLEQEVLRAEYENWLRDEVGLCERMERAMEEKGTKKKSAKGDVDAQDRIRSYCRDCEGTLRVVEEAVGGVVFSRSGVEGFDCFGLTELSI